tara:strand:+ start:284 stop:460 length:177 start_codon:yes stop_codon:yes gene_type:complete
MRPSRITKIEPGFRGEPVLEKTKKVSINKLIDDWIKEENEPDEDSDDESDDAPIEISK